MAPPAGPYSGVSQLALVARVSAFALGLVYGNVKLKRKQNLIRKLRQKHTTDEKKRDGVGKDAWSCRFLIFPPLYSLVVKALSVYHDL
ncbi:hypothetical protein AKJ16_DCAP24685 [Drosera capensis]